MSSTSVFNSQGNRARAAQKNLIINGDFSVWQRGSTLASNGGYLADRWVMDGSTTQQDRSADVPAGSQFVYSARYGGTGIPQVYQGIELPFTGIAGVFQIGQKVTASFWAKAASGDITLIVRFSDSAQSGVNNPGEETFEPVGPVANGTWQKYTHTFTIIHAPNPTNICLRVGIFTGTGIELFVTGFQVELGDTATDFEYRFLGEELFLCQRYYEVSDAATSLSAVRTDQLDATMNFVVSKRVIPAVTFTNIGIPVTTDVFYLEGFRVIDESGGLNTNNRLVTGWIADAEIP